MSEEYPFARRLDDGRILIRQAGREEDGTRTEGWVAIGPDDPEYQEWDEEITAWENNTDPIDDADDYEPIDFENLSFFPDTPPSN